MKLSSLMDAAKARLNVETDYGLAKRLKTPTGHIAEMRSGKRGAPLDVAYKMAIILELDPAQVVAELEAEREKNPERQAFWRSFLSRAAMVAATLACTLAWSFSSGLMAAQVAAFSGIRRSRQYA